MWVWGFSGFCRLRGFAVNPNIRDVKQTCFQAPRDYRLLNWDPQDCCNALRCFLPHRTNPREQSRRREAKVLLELDACSWSGRSEPVAQRAAPRGSSSPRGGARQSSFLGEGPGQRIKRNATSGPLFQRMLREQTLAAPHLKATRRQGLRSRRRARAPGGGKVQHRARRDLRRNKRFILLCAGSLSRLWL